MSRVEMMAADHEPGTPHARSTVTTLELVVIPADMRGKFCAFHADAGSGAAVAVALRFGTETATPVIAGRSALDGGTFVLTADATVPHSVIIAGTKERFKLDPSWTHFAHISSATTGALRFGLATGEG